MKINNKIGGKTAQPFIKWAGGKAQILDQLVRLFPRSYNNYHEPFLGGGAVFFHLAPQKSYLSDINPDLIASYRIIKTNVSRLIKVLNNYRNQNSSKFYYELRERYNGEDLDKYERAAAFIFLNKAGYNGLYRVNSQGRFNVPYGKHANPKMFDVENLFSVSKILKNATLIKGSFQIVLKNAKRDDLVYFDPPYYPLNRTANFTSYTKEGFLEKEQQDLAQVYKELSKKGCKVVLSNSNTEFIKKLYKGYTTHKVLARRFINCDSSKRDAITELVITNY